jgi:hypothetical protein
VTISQCLIENVCPICGNHLNKYFDGLYNNINCIIDSIEHFKVLIVKEKHLIIRINNNMICLFNNHLIANNVKMPVFDILNYSIQDLLKKISIMKVFI